MGFLDNLENNLKSLESREDAAEGDGRERTRREHERAQARAAAPYADRLKNGPFTSALLGHVTRLGYRQRTKVHITWLGSTLRLEARARRLELRPGPEGVTAVFLEDGNEVRSLPVDLEGDPGTLAREWLEPAA
jgi:hypothetical protein